MGDRKGEGDEALRKLKALAHLIFLILSASRVIGCSRGRRRADSERLSLFIFFSTSHGFRSRYGVAMMVLCCSRVD